jgi:nucleoside phosphorylase
LTFVLSAAYLCLVISRHNDDKTYEKALTWGNCWDAWRSVRSAELGRQALRSARPRGVSGIVRSRGPLPLMLYVASRESRVVWHGPGDFLLLEPPITIRLPTRRRGPLPASLRFADKQWQHLVLAVPPLLLMLAAIILALAGAGLVAALLAILLALVYTTVLLTAGVVMGLIWFYQTFGRRQRPSRKAGQEIKAVSTWRIGLCHVTDERQAAGLLRRALLRSHRLVEQQVLLKASELGARATVEEVQEELNCSPSVVTTTAMMAIVLEGAKHGESYQDGDHHVVLRRGKAVPFQRTMDAGGFAFWYLAGMAAVVLVGAQLTAETEQAACAPQCAGRPASFGLALRYLVQRLYFSDPDGLSPATGRAFVFGWLVSLASFIGIVVLAAAVTRYRSFVKESNKLGETMSARALLIVATDVELDQTLKAVNAANNTPAWLDYTGDQTVYDLGTVSETQVLLAQCEQSSLGVSGSTLTTAELVRRLNPDFVIMVGICFGLRDQALGDILVSRQLNVFDHRKVSQDGEDGLIVEIRRGDIVPPSHVLLDRFRSVRASWDGARVHFGQILSSNTLVNSPVLRRKLIALEPEAIGGEMEGSGVYAASARRGTHWILVKGVADYGMDKKKDAQELAASNAANFVVRMISMGALDKAP